MRLSKVQFYLVPHQEMSAALAIVAILICAFLYFYFNNKAEIEAKPSNEVSRLLKVFGKQTVELLVLDNIEHIWLL
uniref:Uncharacterized protein n=1 Tax=Haemonchus contortus TaxID=6289 RepID=W6ND18_HAECO